MVGTGDFAKMVPGFEFLQSLMKNGAGAMPAIGQWVAPTLDPAEIEKRINDLRTVQFWLEQNARLIGATIQALEVQRMTLSTLQTMNLPMADVRDALKIKPAEPAPMPMPMPTSKPAAPAAGGTPAQKSAPPRRAKAESTARAAAPAAVDPMQWWGALTQQFTEIAATALKDGAGALPMGAAAAPVSAATATTAAPARTAARRRKG